MLKLGKTRLDKIWKLRSSRLVPQSSERSWLDSVSAQLLCPCYSLFSFLLDSVFPLRGGIWHRRRVHQGIDPPGLCISSRQAIFHVWLYDVCCQICCDCCQKNLSVEFDTMCNKFIFFMHFSSQQAKVWISTILANIYPKDPQCRWDSNSCVSFSDWSSGWDTWHGSEKDGEGMKRTV